MPLSNKPRWGISGSAGTGKTTLAQELARQHDVPYLEEGFRRRRENGLNPHSLTRDQHRELVLELYDEAIAEVRQSIADHGGFVADRCPVDYLAFWLYYGFSHSQEQSEQLANLVERDMALFDRVIILPWAGIPLESDGIRSTNPWIQLHYQGLFEGLAHRRIPAEKRCFLPDGIKQFSKRIEWVNQLNTPDSPNCCSSNDHDDLKVLPLLQAQSVPATSV